MKKIKRKNKIKKNMKKYQKKINQNLKQMILHLNNIKKYFLEELLITLASFIQI